MTAADGREALERLRQDGPDVALLDADLPELDGLAVLDAVVSDPALFAIPVVLLAGSASIAEVDEGLARGAHDYLKKPVEGGELASRVRAALRTRALAGELHSPVLPVRRHADLVAASELAPGTGPSDEQREHDEATASSARAPGELLAGREPGGAVGDLPEVLVAEATSLNQVVATRLLERCGFRRGSQGTSVRRWRPSRSAPTPPCSWTAGCPSWTAMTRPARYAGASRAAAASRSSR